MIIINLNLGIFDNYSDLQIGKILLIDINFPGHRAFIAYNRIDKSYEGAEMIIGVFLMLMYSSFINPNFQRNGLSFADIHCAQHE